MFNAKTNLLQKKLPQSVSALKSKCVIFLCGFMTTSMVQAEDKNPITILVPSYDNSILADGFDRWNQSQNFSQGYVVHKSILFENINKQNLDANNLRSSNSGRHDRTSNHLPISYNITVKGYSVYEANEDIINLWSFDKIELNMNKKPELFFGVQKSFY